MIDPTVDAELQPADDQMWKMVTCPIVNVHFYRNFETDSSDQDVQFSVEDDPVKEYNIIGFVRRHNLKDFSSPAKFIFGDIESFTPVSAAY